MTAPYSIRLDDDQHRDLKLLSEMTGAPMAYFIRRGINREIDRHREELDELRDELGNPTGGPASG